MHQQFYIFLFFAFTDNHAHRFGGTFSSIDGEDGAFLPLLQLERQDQ
jgi:hypothetical protein